MCRRENNHRCAEGRITTEVLNPELNPRRYKPGIKPTEVYTLRYNTEVYTLRYNTEVHTEVHPGYTLRYTLGTH